MTQLTTFKRGCNAMSTCLQGEIRTNYSDLVECFGEPDGNFDDYKSDANWDITFADGTIATIYNWKNGRNYCGDAGLDKEYITEWHIGGRNRNAVRMVEAAMQAYLDGVCVKA